MNSPATSISADQTNSPSNSRVSRRGWSLFWRQQRFAILLFSILGLSLALFVYYQATYVSGTEFNAKHWRLRSFSFRRDPFTNTQLTGVLHDEFSTFAPWKPAVSYSFIDPAIGNFLKPLSTLQDRWDLVGFDTSLSKGNANILVQYLLVRDSNYDFYWPQWTADHPQKAKVLWPAAQVLVALELYHKLPPLFESALSNSSLTAFQSQVSSTVRSAVDEEVQTLRDLGNIDQAEALLQAAENYGLYNLLEPESTAESE